jgi:hypothetical protein
MEDGELGNTGGAYTTIMSITVPLSPKEDAYRTPATSPGSTPSPAQQPLEETS